MKSHPFESSSPFFFFAYASTTLSCPSNTVHLTKTYMIQSFKIQMFLLIKGPRCYSINQNKLGIVMGLHTIAEMVCINIVVGIQRKGWEKLKGLFMFGWYCSVLLLIILFDCSISIFIVSSRSSCYNCISIIHCY